MTERDAAWAKLHDPATDAATLAEVVSAYPEFASAAAEHPNSYPELRAWAASSGAPPVNESAVAPSESVPSMTPEPFLHPDNEHATKSTRSSGWEKAEKIGDGVDAVFGGIGWVLTKLWGLILLIGAIAIFAIAPSVWWAGLLAGAYGVYLLLPGDKWVIW